MAFEDCISVCESCGQPVLTLKHHYVNGRSRFDFTPWQPEDFVTSATTKAAKARAWKDYLKDIDTAPFRKSMALLDFERGTYELVQPLAGVRKVKPGRYYQHHVCKEER